MHRKTLFTILFLAFVAIALPLGLTVLSNQTSKAELGRTGTVSVSIAGGISGRPIAIREGDTVLRALQALQEQEPALRLETKEYSGLGVLVESMYGQTNGSQGKYWQYTVNGVAPQVGADAFALSADDTVEWSFSEPSF